MLGRQPMNRLIKAAITERKVTFLLAIMIFFYGMYSYYFIPKQENPDTSSPAAQIVTIYPGATAKEVEEQVTIKIEDELSALDGIENIVSYSNPNVSVVIVTLNYEVDYDEQWARMRVLLDKIKPNLPSNVYDYQIETELTKSAGIILSLSGENYTYEQLATYANTFKSELSSVDGVSRVYVEGAPDKELQIKLHLDQLNQLPLSIKDIFDLISAQTVNIPVGELETSYGSIGVKHNLQNDQKSAYESMIVYGSSESGSMIKLSDISDIEMGYANNQHSYKHGEDNAVLVTVYFDANQNVILVGDDVRSVIDEEKEKFPAELHVNEVLFQPEEVSRSIDGFLMNLLQGIGFVVIVVLIGMGFRNAFVVSIAIPLSVTMTVVMMKLIGVDIQQMSIAALIIALGMLVDNSIVISDAIQLKLNEGLPISEACYEGTVEQATPVLTSTLTTVVAFAPLIILPGEAGEFAKSLPQVVIIALIASYIVAMLVTPALASLVFKANRTSQYEKHRLRRLFEYGLKGSMRLPKFSLFIILIILAATVYGATFLSIELFPYTDKDLIYIDVFSEKKGDLEYTQSLSEELYAILDQEEGITDINSSIGGGFPKFYLTVGVRPESADYTQTLITFDLSQTEGYNSREDFAYHLQTLLDEQLKGGFATVSLLEINQPGPSLDIRVSGDSLEEVRSVSDDIYGALLSREETINVQTDSASYRYQYLLDEDLSKMSQFGLNAYDVQLQTALAVNGMTVANLPTDKPITVVLTGDINSITDLENFSIKSSATGEKTLLKQFADISLKSELNTIKRYNRQPTVSVSANVTPGYSVGTLQGWVQDSLIPSLDTEDVQISYGGDQEIFDKYISGLLGAAGVAVVIIYIILLIQFNSLQQPLIILMTVPLSVVGSVVALLIFNQSVTFTVGLGVASLIGVVVNNAILLIEYINRERKMAHDVYNSCLNSVGRRFRPIMLSTITTVIGLVPMALSGSSFFSPMAMALMGGLIVSTLLTLIVIPLIYYQLHKREDFVKEDKITS